MAKKPGGGGRSFQEFLKEAPSLEEAASDDSVELTGLVSRTTDGRFAITTHAGQTYELDVDAVRDFREEEGPGGSSAATIRVGRDLLTDASLRPLKPAIKDLIKDPIKDIIHDGKRVFKDVHKDPLSDPVTFVQEQIGTGAGDAIGIDPGMGPLVNPAMNYAAGTYAAAPFVMATPHQAPQHLLALQMGGALPKPIKDPPKDGLIADPPKNDDKLVADHPPPPKDPRTDNTVKEPIQDTPHITLKELILDTRKELVLDTHKELVVDTHKELVWDTFVEGGANTLAESVFDPRQALNQQGQPGFGYGYGFGRGA